MTERTKKIKPSLDSHLKFKICVSGAAETGHCESDALEKAKELGKEIVRHNAVLVTGATTGFPFWSAVGAKEAGGFSIGLSPAFSEREHIEKYRLPVDYFDIIIYTGFGYAGRNLLLTRSSDAVIVGCGRIGTLNEFTIAFEDEKPIGVLTGTGGTADQIKEIVEKSNRGPGNVVYHSDPKILIEKVLEMVREEKIIDI
ncbi:hypothetical protein KKA27_03150 [Patescibacteria group bacterium]|nr:hypothetical protein [Patescibacteria group bacterium]MBU2632885.1 hypothetical protein [Patescibacteria group bacterium]